MRCTLALPVLIKASNFSPGLITDHDCVKLWQIIFICPNPADH